MKNKKLFCLLLGAWSIALLSCSFDMMTAPEDDKAKGPIAVLIELDGPVPNFPTPTLLEKSPVSQYRVERLLKKATKDPNVKEIVVHFGTPQLGWARAGELSTAISKAVKSSKEVTCHLESADNRTYWLAASGCTRIVVAPAGGVDLIGLALQAVFVKDLLDSVGVKADMLHVGKYKDAADTVTRNNMSEAAREASESLLNDLHTLLVNGIAKGRNMDIAKVEKLIDNGPYTSKQAKEQGLVDDVTTLGRLLAQLEDKYKGGVVDDYGKKPAKQMSMTDLLTMLGGGPGGSDKLDEPCVALIPAIGPISSGNNGGLMGNSESIYDYPLVKTLGEAKRDDAVKAVVLRIDSPGGSALASDNIWEAVYDLAKKKPVIASMGDVAASGGYYIASAATEVYANPGTLTGSIGVVGGKMVIAQGLDKMGVHTETIKKGSRSAMTSPFQPFTESERLVITAMMKDTYNLFVDRIVKGRKLKKEDVLKVAEGRVWSGQQAAKFGLVTQKGSLHDAIEKAKGLVSLPAGPVHIYPRPKSMMEMLSEQFSQDELDVAMRLLTLKRIPGGKNALAFYSLLFDNSVLAVSPLFLDVR